MVVLRLCLSISHNEAVKIFSVISCSERIPLQQTSSLMSAWSPSQAMCQMVLIAIGMSRGL